ncbi:transmembrane protein 198-like isoform X1 [Haliotis rufescens]|uniref:transmembrane protein 198-like isoform X1 n=1 Tax=Haliotis rufescens TaxID=6454 RepID=UPI001EB022E9|nr:transmembrane protein 198-like isoform X1 [Haliotis rufescens]XP_046375920.1 transmembrane protein 198-like isoform X1 [Haliotis rufescens]XP_046375921.1 transmembrane protein 198-like isoform X1 [Haliotis rufescens]XP_046375922.1 transmembrane protein 198-like isoform X1 [Haliotis rufescens]XP_046375923.1 transmembrane protein 198-like isoform X1 [Haliotis rufescens]XP_046375924.1 transmembrane protein 198-like isoform X1 [Haliotis rufescens]XP_046375925.1 transmembrane protein 198-like i
MDTTVETSAASSAGDVTYMTPRGNMTTMTPLLHQCDHIDSQYDVASAIVCAMCFIFGILYTFFGYRFFKAIMFLTGFIFGGVLIYMICKEEEIMPTEGNIGVAIGAGILCGLITMLVQYVGLFLTGFHLGLALAIAVLIVLEQFMHPSTKWIPIGLLVGLGLLFAFLILKFQKCFTILGTSIFGGALMVAFLDYFIEKFRMVLYVWDRVKGNESPPVCWYSWVILGCWPFCFLVGAITQWRITGQGVDHREALHINRSKKVNLKRIRARERRDEQHSRYRHLYQVRRVNGDVISQVNNQDYIQSIQGKLSPAMRSLTDPMTEVESANTTLTQVP